MNFNQLDKVAESFTELLEEPVSEGFVAKLTEKQRAYIHFLLCAGKEAEARKIMDEVKYEKHYSDKAAWFLKQKGLIN